MKKLEKVLKSIAKTDKEVEVEPVNKGRKLAMPRK
jgi:hypothetical protein